MELRVTVTVEPTERHQGKPLTRAQVERVVTLREWLEQAVAAALAQPPAARQD